MIGREQDVESIVSMMLRDDMRLLTLTGPGGIGKTRLAVGAAEALVAQILDDIVFIELAPLRDPSLVLSAIARALSIPEVSGKTIEEVTKGFLFGQRLLLVLDNFEHLVEAAPLVSELLAHSPFLKMLITSREALHVSAEHRFTVSPLAVPPTTSEADIANAAAVRLFLTRAGLVDPAFTLTRQNAVVVVEICRRVDGIPLAIELAAARIAHLSPAALLARLCQGFAILTSGPRDVPPRLQNMRNAVAWSYELLIAEEQHVFRGVAVFVGGFSLTAAMALVGDCASGPNSGVSEENRAFVPTRDLLDVLTALIDKSLLQKVESPVAEPRFIMLETIREYALEQLIASGGEATGRDEHARYFVEFAEEIEPELAGPEQGRWLRQLETDHDNIRAALAWLAESGRSELLLRLAGALGRFWPSLGYQSEGRAWLARALECAEVPLSIRAKALRAAGWLSVVQADYIQAMRLSEEALACYRDDDNQEGIGRALTLLGEVNRRVGELDEARTNLEMALDLYQGTDNKSRLSGVLHDLALVASDHGDYERAIALFDEALVVWRALGYKWGIACCTPTHLGDVARAQHNYGRATSHYLESLTLSHEQADMWQFSLNLIGLASVAVAWQQPELAALLMGAAAALRNNVDAPVTPNERDTYDQVTREARSSIGDALLAEKIATGQAMSLEAVIAQATAISPLAHQRSSATKTGLTKRELEVLQLLTAGQTDREIADALCISHRTVNAHVTQILAKLGAKSRAEAAANAVRDDLVQAARPR
ncbi:MAG: LuxR C-terminal-related transcriptional regulator [Chloroflexota bacterium]|nr:LuxR C-terminal-related transcriptional regulator [Chloroflexota bacterium]